MSNSPPRASAAQHLSFPRRIFCARVVASLFFVSTASPLPWPALRRARAQILGVSCSSDPEMRGRRSAGRRTTLIRRAGKTRPHACEACPSRATGTSASRRSTVALPGPRCVSGISAGAGARLARRPSFMAGYSLASAKHFDAAGQNLQAQGLETADDRSTVRSQRSQPFPGGRDATQFMCVRCGQFALTGAALAILPGQIDARPNRRALMSHKLRRMYEPQHKVVWVDSTFDPFWIEDRLPSPQQQADYLILKIGDTLVERAPSEQVLTGIASISAWIGTGVHQNSSEGLHWLLQELGGNLIEYVFGAEGKIAFRLKMPGWERYQTLKKTNPDSRTAFMAMKFGDAELDSVASACFKPAVRRTGFDLRLLTDQQPAGLIDDQIRASIISGRFVLADLTHGSHGAYWEAGFAEGRGLPVIYTCRRSVWDQTRTHFDTNHLVTILWDSSDLARAENELTATIRATLREHARQTDD